MINLNKGGMINLQKADAGLQRVRVGLGWDPNNSSTGAKFDLDVSAFVLKHVAQKPIAISEGHFVFYNNKMSPEGAVIHKGDNQDGAAEGPDEIMLVDLAKIPSEAAEISFIVTIHEAEKRKQNFGQVKNSYIAIYNDETNVEIARYDLREEFSNETAVQFGSIERNSSGSFSFAAIGAGFNNGLSAYIQQYGL